jgi:hypothetical protein
MTNRSAPAILCLLVAVMVASGQTAIVYWPSRTASCPATGLGRSLPVELRDVNDILYNYRVDISVKPSVPIDFPNIQGAFGGWLSGNELSLPLLVLRCFSMRIKTGPT